MNLKFTVFLLYALAFGPVVSAADCDLLLARLGDSVAPSLAKIMRRYADRAEMKPVVDGIKSLEEFEVKGPNGVSGRAQMIRDGVLEVRIDWVGYGDQSLKNKKEKLHQMMAAISQLPQIYISSGKPNALLGTVMAAIGQGIGQRLEMNPGIREVVIVAENIENVGVRSLLMERFGFELVSTRSVGGASAFTLEKRYLLQ